VGRVERSYLSRYTGEDNWTLLDASVLYQKLEKEYRGCGYLLAMYGSVPQRGGGRDLDLLAVPWRPDVTPPDLMEPFLSSLGLKPKSEIYVGSMYTWCRFYSLSDGRVIDLQYRK
jgi:hypothetical protein